MMRSVRNASRRLLPSFLIFAGGVAAGLGFALGDPADLFKAEAHAAQPAMKASALPDPAPPRKQSALASMVERIGPSVVTVGAIKRAVVYDTYRGGFFRPFIRVPREAQYRTPFLGSGFVIDRDGHIITNQHVVEGSARVFVTLNDGTEVEAEVLGEDPMLDIALLKVDLPVEELPEPMELADSDNLSIAETVLAFGNPFGNLIEDPRPTVTRGVISALHRSFRPDFMGDGRNVRIYQDMIQTDAAINPGNSGGPLVDEFGRVIGVNTFIVSRDGGSSGLGFAIPVNRVRSFVNEILEHGRTRPPLVDFNVLPLDTPRVQGLLINQIEPDGPAQEAELEVGDVITSVNGRPVRAKRDMALLLLGSSDGEVLTLEVWRSGRERTVKYVVEKEE